MMTMTQVIWRRVCKRLKLILDWTINQSANHQMDIYAIFVLQLDIIFKIAPGYVNTISPIDNFYYKLYFRLDHEAKAWRRIKDVNDVLESLNVQNANANGYLETLGRTWDKNVLNAVSAYIRQNR